MIWNPFRVVAGPCTKYEQHHLSLLEPVWGASHLLQLALISVASLVCLEGEIQDDLFARLCVCARVCFRMETLGFQGGCEAKG